MFLSLRKVDDPGTQQVISSLAFGGAPEADEEIMDHDSANGVDGEAAGIGSVEIREGGEVEIRQRNTSKLEA